MFKKYILQASQLEWFKENYSALGGQKCSEHLKLPVRFLRKTARKYGLKVCKSVIAQNCSKRIIKMHQDKFQVDMLKIKDITIDSPEKAYSLGFLWGDGYLVSHSPTCKYINFSIVRSDFDNIFKYFECWGKWSIHYAAERRGHKEQGQATLCNRIMGWFLKENDYKNKSTVSPTKILSNIPEVLRHYWWRGYIDADGCFYYHHKQYLYQFSIAGSYNQDWQETMALFSLIGIKKYKVNRRLHTNYKSYKDTRDSVIRVSNSRDIVKLGDYIYRDGCDIGLIRKYEKYLVIKNHSVSHIVSSIE